MTRSSLDACQREWVSRLQDGPSSKWGQRPLRLLGETKAHCGYTIREAEAAKLLSLGKQRPNTPLTLGRQRPTVPLLLQRRNHCTNDIRKVESHCAKHACSIQQLHAEGMQHLETEAIKEEGKRMPLLPSHLWNSIIGLSHRSHGVLMGPSNTPGKHALATLLNIPPVSSTWEESTLVVSHSTTPMAPGPSLRTKWWHPSPNQVVSPP